MSLVSQVGPITSTGGFWPEISARTEENMRIATTCHFATVYWLFHEAYGRPITFDEYLNIGNPEVFISSLIPFGIALQQSYKTRKAAGLKVQNTGALVQSGSVIIFAKTRTQAGHSCVALTSQKVGGYNQTDWFSSPGTPHEYTTHDTIDIQWSTKQLATVSGKEFMLFAVSESKALEMLKAKAKAG